MNNTLQYGENNEVWNQRFCEILIEEFPNFTPASLFNYYKGLFLIKAGRSYESCTFFEKAIIAEPNFWAARLELLQISLAHQNVSPIFKEQINFFLEEGQEIKRFICTNCGLKLKNIFFICPKCHSCHSATLRHSFRD